MLCIILCFQGAICSPNVSSWPWKHQQAASYSLVNKPFNEKSSISGFLDFYILFKNCDFSLPAILLYRNQQLLYLDFWFSENRALLNQLLHHFRLPTQTDHHYHVGNQTHSPFSDRSVSDCCSQGCGRTVSAPPPFSSSSPRVPRPAHSPSSWRRWKQCRGWHRRRPRFNSGAL